jgi:capsular polysaccharide biosynthesis protein
MHMYPSHGAGVIWEGVLDFDIKDYLYAIRRRLWLPIAVPLAAALVASGIIYLQPEQYQATATVIVPALSARGYSTSAVTQYFSTYKDVLTSTPVINKVAAETGESKNNLVAGLSANVVTASSNIIVVTYTGSNKKTVDNVAQTAAVDALDVLLGPQQSANATAVTNAQAALDAANQKLSDFIGRTGHTFPEDDYKLANQALAAYTVQLEQARLTPDNRRATGIRIVIDKRTAELKALVPIVIEWQGINQSISSAQSELSHAQIDLNTVNAEIASNHAPGSVTVKSLGHISRIPTILKYGGVAAGVALLLALAFIVFMEFFRPAVAQVPYLRKLAIPARPSSADGELEMATVAVPSAAAVAVPSAAAVAVPSAAAVAVPSAAAVAVPADGEAKELPAVTPSGNGSGSRKKGR